MTRAPLTLSDTAMVLLRQYSELEGDYWAARMALSKIFPQPSREIDAVQYEWYETHNYSHVIGEIRWALMQEIWLLWTFPDIPIVRHLEWHLVFNMPLTTMAEKTFIPHHEYPRRNIRFMTRKPTESSWFLETLEIAYKKQLATRAKALLKADA